MAVEDWSTSAGANTGIVPGVIIDGAIMTPPQIDNALRDMAAQIAVWRDSIINLIVPAGYIHGLTLSNNVSDTANDIDIAIGSAASDSTTPKLMSLASALTKRVDGSWSVGTNQGGLDTGSIASATYHVFLIQRSDTGVVDA